MIHEDTKKLKIEFESVYAEIKKTEENKTEEIGYMV